MGHAFSSVISRKVNSVGEEFLKMLDNEGDATIKSEVCKSLISQMSLGVASPVQHVQKFHGRTGEAKDSIWRCICSGLQWWKRWVPSA
jgi:hypothetical protein